MTSILDHPLISERYFFPRLDPPSAPFRVMTDGFELVCHYKSRGNQNLCIYFHGNGEVAGDYEGYDEWFDAMGYDLLVAEYRGYGGSTGVPKLAAMLEDVSPIVEASGFPPEKIVFFGRSVGSIYAIEAASRFPEAAGLILESGIANVGQRIRLRATFEELGTTEAQFNADVSNAVDHHAKLSQVGHPVLILHAANDFLVEVDHAETNARSAGENAQLVVFDFGDHNSIFFANREAYMETVARFFADL